LMIGSTKSVKQKKERIIEEDEWWRSRGFILAKEERKLSLVVIVEQVWILLY
jgi:hypothetical protein